MDDDRRFTDEELMALSCDPVPGQPRHENYVLYTARPRARKQEAWLVEKVNHAKKMVAHHRASGNDLRWATCCGILSSLNDILADHRRMWRLPEGGE